MSNSERLALNIDFLRSPGNFSPERFDGDIIGQEGQKVGFWVARTCHNLDELVKYFPFAEPGIPAIIGKRSRIWPLAFLERIEVAEDQRNKGWGKIGLLNFRVAACKRECLIAMLRIGWSDGSQMERNLQFYRANGWIELFEKDVNGVPIDEPLSYYEL